MIAKVVAQPSIHSRILAGEDLEVKPSPDPLETCPYEVRFKAGDQTLIAKVESEPHAELIKAAFLCMYQVLGKDAPDLIKNDIEKKLLGTGERDLVMAQGSEQR